MTPRSSKYLKAKLKPFTEWVQSELDDYGCVSNEEAKAKYTELSDAPKTQSAWSKLCSRMRKRFGLQSTKAKSHDGQWKYFWSPQGQDSD